MKKIIILFCSLIVAFGSVFANDYVDIKIAEDDIIKKFSKKVEPLKVMEASPIVEKPTMPTTTRSIPGYSDKVDNLVAEIEELI